MKKRLGYLTALLLLLAMEVLIGLFVRDRFIRPYVGDMLVTILLCCMSRTLLPKLSPTLPVFLFSAIAEGLQWLRLSERLGLEGTLWGIILGSTFDWRDILCYGLGCILFATTEYLVLKKWHPIP